MALVRVFAVVVVVKLKCYIFVRYDGFVVMCQTYGVLRESYNGDFMGVLRESYNGVLWES